jgi:hypothetical protein
MTDDKPNEGSAFAGILMFIVAPILGIVAGFVWTWYVGIAVAIGLSLLTLYVQHTITRPGQHL